MHGVMRTAEKERGSAKKGISFLFFSTMRDPVQVSDHTYPPFLSVFIFAKRPVNEVGPHDFSSGPSSNNSFRELAALTSAFNLNP